MLIVQLTAILLVFIMYQAKVRLPDRQLVDAIPIFHGSNKKLSVVSVLPKGTPLRAAACLDHHKKKKQQQQQPDCQIASVRRSFDSGHFMATAGMLAGEVAIYFYDALLISLLLLCMSKINN